VLERRVSTISAGVVAVRREVSMDLFTTLGSNCTDTQYNGSSYVRG
jgi:hypothetical protein